MVDAKKVNKVISKWGLAVPESQAVDPGAAPPKIGAAPKTAPTIGMPLMQLGLGIQPLELGTGLDPITLESVQEGQNEKALKEQDAWAKSLQKAREWTSAGGMTGKTIVPPGATGQESQRGTGKYGLQMGFWKALSAANAAMKAAGLGTFTVTDGFRSYAQQVATKKAKGRYAATPGKSIHGIGKAADLNLTTAQQNWLYKNGKKFGIYAPMFTARKPGGIVEKWHWQWMG